MRKIELTRGKYAIVDDKAYDKAAVNYFGIYAKTNFKECL